MVGGHPRPRPAPGAPPAGRTIAKSIHAQLSLEWIDDEFAITPLVLLRHPANVLASWMEVQLKDGRNSTLESRPEVRTRFADRWDVPPPGQDPIEKMCWRIGLLIAALEEALARHPDWQMRTHEQLCTDSVATFRTLFADLDLPWGETTEAYLVENDTPGEGFATRRVASELSDSWQKRLDDDQVATLRRRPRPVPDHHLDRRRLREDVPRGVTVGRVRRAYPAAGSGGEYSPASRW